MNELELLQREIDVIKQRNARVEADKAWETSLFRVGIICAMTYVVASAVLYFIGSQNFWLNALVPTIGFFLSAQSLPAIKKWWIKSRYSR